MNEIIFLNENDNLYEKILEYKISIKELKPYLNTIYKKSNNNNIGYFKFKANNDEFIKICILPKIFNINEKDLENKFLNYINTYFKILYKYNRHNLMIRKDLDNYTDIRISVLNKNINTLDELLEYKYILAIDYIEKYFKKYIKSQRVTLNYRSCKVKHKIDIKKNACSINKSKISQIINKKENKSEIVDITNTVLCYFINNKLATIENSKTIKNKVTSIQRDLSNNFLIKEYKLKVKNIISCKTRRLFNGSKMKLLFNNLLILLDIDSFFKNNEEYININSVKQITYISFNPADIYEYYVFDRHKEDGLNDILFIKLHKDNKQFSKHEKLFYKVPIINETELDSNLFIDDNIILEEYEYLSKIDRNKYKAFRYEKETRKSEPDLILQNKIKDCKWKILRGKIDYFDYIKLKNDCKIRGINRGGLVYPLITSNKYLNKELIIEDSDFENGIFYLDVEEYRIDENFNKINQDK